MRTRRGEGRKCASLVDANVQNLSLGGFRVGVELCAVDADVLLAFGVVDLGGAKVAVHSEGARLIRDDRNDSAAHALVTQQIFEKSGEGHR